MVEGFVDPRFAPVAAVFARQLPHDRPGGAALTVVHRGETVVDIWGGTRDAAGRRWTPDTLALSFSTTKGVVSTLLHLLADRGAVSYARPVADYWPEFAQAGKGSITLRTLMSHEAGLYDVRRLVRHARDLNDWQRMLDLLAAAAPAHPPGARNGYHGLTYGYLVGAVIEKVTGLRLSEVLHRELVEPMGLDGAFIGLPRNERRRVASLLDGRAASAGPGGARRTPAATPGASPGVVAPLHHLARRATRAAIRARSEPLRAALLPHGLASYDWNGADVMGACNPSAGGMFTARSLARIYAMLAEGGELDGRRYLSEPTLRALSTVQNRRVDDVLQLPMHWRLGYHRVFSLNPRAPRAFGHFGYGGSGAWADPSRRLSLGFTVNSATGSPVGDLRIMRITSAALRAADARR